MESTKLDFEATLSALMELLTEDVTIMVMHEIIFSAAIYGRLAQIDETSQDIKKHFPSFTRAHAVADDEIMELIIADGEEITSRILVPKKLFIRGEKKGDALQIYLSGYHLSIWPSDD